MIADIPKNKQLILFDGVCNLCNSSVLFVIKRDRKNKFMFAPLQSDIGTTVLEHFAIDRVATDSILLFDPQVDKIHMKSSAALRIARSLSFPTKLMGLFFIVPTFIRNWVYDIIARNRYKWFGRKDACMIPTPELQAKFLN